MAAVAGRLAPIDSTFQPPSSSLLLLLLPSLMEASSGWRGACSVLLPSVVDDDMVRVQCVACVGGRCIMHHGITHGTLVVWTRYWLYIRHLYQKTSRKNVIATSSKESRISHSLQPSSTTVFSRRFQSVHHGGSTPAVACSLSPCCYLSGPFETKLPTSVY